MNAELSLQDLALESIELLPDRDTLQFITGGAGSAAVSQSNAATITQSNAATTTATGGGASFGG